MRTMQLQKTDGAGSVAKRHQFLAEDLHPMGQVLQFVGEADRLPKAAQIFAAWRVWADMGEFCVFGGHLAMEVAAKSRRQKRGSGDHCSDPFQLIGLAGTHVRGFFSAHCATWDRSKATNPLESCRRSQSHASGKGRY